MSDLIRRLQRLNYSIHSNGYKDSAILEAIDAIQQAHRHATEEVAQAHKRGWEQAKREAIKEIQSNPIIYPVTVGGGIVGQYVVDTVAVNAIASMEYKGGQR